MNEVMNHNYQYNEPTNIGKITRVQSNNLKTPYGMTFENEEKIKQQERRKYKEDLDYLVSLRQRGDEDRYNTDVKTRVSNMNEVSDYF